jgi:hypothetical protein
MHANMIRTKKEALENIDKQLAYWNERKFMQSQKIFTIEWQLLQFLKEFICVIETRESAYINQLMYQELDRIILDQVNVITHILNINNTHNSDNVWYQLENGITITEKMHLQYNQALPRYGTQPFPLSVLRAYNHWMMTKAAWMGFETAHHPTHQSVIAVKAFSIRSTPEKPTSCLIPMDETMKIIVSIAACLERVGYTNTAGIAINPDNWNQYIDAIRKDNIN